MLFEISDLGLIDFAKAYQAQKEIFEDVLKGLRGSTLLFCRHYPVVTLGRQAKNENLKVSPEFLQEKGIKVYPIERGGNVTYHGPGQLIVYPIFDLNHFKKDIHWFLRQLEEVIIEVLTELKIRALRYDKLTGVWADKRKIASIGIAVRRWITFHGLSLNVKQDDLDNFQLIDPCGMDIEMTSVESILQREIEIEEIKSKMGSKFNDIFKGGR